MRRELFCSHCQHNVSAKVYIDHVQECIAARMRNWNQAEYSTRYFEQVRDQSRFQYVDEKTREKIRAWVKLRLDGPPLRAADFGIGHYISREVE